MYDSKHFAAALGAPESYQLHLSDAEEWFPGAGDVGLAFGGVGVTRSSRVL